MQVSIGVMAHNEARNIGRLLEALIRQRTNAVQIQEIIVVSSGSTDRTDDIVRGVKEKRIKLVVQRERLGKSSAINEFLKIAKCNICVLSSADIVPEPGCIERLCAHLEDASVGIVACHPVPSNTAGLMGSVIRLQWVLQHRLSLSNPKYGEMIAFRKVFDGIGMTAVDEERISMLVKAAGLKGAYAPDAVVHNKGPETFADFLRQRRRIYCGHLRLRSQGHSPSSMNALRIIRMIPLARLPAAVPAVLLEAIARALGAWDYVTGRDHTIWEIAESAK